MDEHYILTCSPWLARLALFHSPGVFALEGHTPQQAGIFSSIIIEKMSHGACLTSDGEPQLTAQVTLVCAKLAKMNEHRLPSGCFGLVFTL